MVARSSASELASIRLKNWRQQGNKWKAVLVSTNSSFSCRGEREVVGSSWHRQQRYAESQNQEESQKIAYPDWRQTGKDILFWREHAESTACSATIAAKDLLLQDVTCHVSCESAAAEFECNRNFSTPRFHFIPFILHRIASIRRQLLSVPSVSFISRARNRSPLCSLPAHLVVIANSLPR